MATWRSKKTPETRKIEKLLLKHFPNHPTKYPPAAYRYNPASIRVRVVSDRFAGMNRVQRFELVSAILEKNLSEQSWDDVMLVLTYTPEEVDDAWGNIEFEHPHPLAV